jgi:EAL domain-containing protein (putative c-di-GMP-specific phosphodiesterase class I)
MSLEIGFKMSALFITLYCVTMSYRCFSMRIRYLSGFILICIDTFICSALAVVSSLGDEYGIPVPYMTIETFYAIFHVAVGYLILLYFLQVFGSPVVRNVKKMLLIGLPVFVLQAGLCLNIVTHSFLYFKGSAYMRGPLWDWMVLVPSAYFLVFLVYLVAKRRALPADTFGLIMVGYILTIIGVLTQHVFRIVRIELFCESAYILIMFLTLQNVNAMIDDKTRLYSKETLTDDCRRMIYLHQKFILVDIRILSRQSGFEFYDDDQKNEINEVIARDLWAACKGDLVYDCGRWHYVVLLQNLSEQDCKEKLDWILMAAIKPRPVGTIWLDVHVAITPLRQPENVASVQEIESFLSIETTIFKPTDLAPDTQVADDNLYRAKRFTQVERAIQRALQNDRIDVELQPIRRRQDQSVNTVEMILKIQDPQIGYISADEILPVAEKSGMIQTLGMKTLKKCCAIVRDSHLMELGITRVHLNLSNYQLLYEGTATEYVRTVRSYGLDPSAFVFQFTRDAFLEQNRDAEDMLRKLKNFGFSIVLDHFGKASTNIIQELKQNMDGVKIDETVLKGAMEDQDRSMMLKTIIQTLRSNGKIVYLTGVDTREEAAFASTSECDYVQGSQFRLDLIS